MDKMNADSEILDQSQPIEEADEGNFNLENQFYYALYSSLEGCTYEGEPLLGSDDLRLRYHVK